MTTSASPQSPFDFFGLDWTAPHPRQDADFLKQLPFVPGLKEFLMLRQVHALEHATVWVLSESGNQRERGGDNDLLGGMSTERGFYLYGNVNAASLQRAVRTALQRITGGEWNLAVHPRCGTNLSVGMVLTAGLAFGIHMLLPKGPLVQILGLGVAATTAAQLAPDLGGLAQKYLTTAIPFNLAIADISSTRDIWGRPAHFVHLTWVD
ncbi:DUF6391 domain-containing protein [Aerosakkonema funiforme]|uniref:Uncharacterized protein n=2 Tax=Oscillatoriophycideae TaxID=1301283 RepID=A0A926VAW5_9CYAN|nr:DUF6391 domain-containing protein [Aerosakkonema funiforme]MBD2180452.1 hypothetical protein [Aerosakkonema funiforme FACHB-1375]